MKYPVSEPDLSDLERRYVDEAIQSTWISSSGYFLDKFEAEFAEIATTKHCLAVSNGTVALELILRSLGIGPGDEVIVPSFTYIASVNAIKYVGATPIFAEISEETWGIDPTSLDGLISDKTVAVIAVHLYGHPVDLELLSEFCKNKEILLIEDAAEAPFSSVNGKPVGSWGIASSYSFYGNKVITCGEGGAVCTDDDSLAQQMRLLKNQGMDPDRRYIFPVIGHNFRLTNVAAAILCAQLERLDGILERRSAIITTYDRILGASEVFQLQPKQDWATRTPWIYSILFANFSEKSRDALMEDLRDESIETRPLFYPVHTMAPYKASEIRANLDLSKKIGSSGLNLPTSSLMKPADAAFIADKVLRLAI